jgi:hypothetical protein
MLLMEQEVARWASSKRPQTNKRECCVAQESNRGLLVRSTRHHILRRSARGGLESSVAIDKFSVFVELQMLI